MRLNIIDSTLRDGEQAPGVIFYNREKLDLAKKLDLAGVDIIEVGIPASGHYERTVIKDINDLGLRSEIMSWNRMSVSDVDESLECNIKNMHLSIPVSDIQIEKKIFKDREWVLKESARIIRYAVDKGAVLSIGGEDCSRSNMDFLYRFLDILSGFNVKRFRYADTMGLLNPLDTFEIISNIRKRFDLEIDFHGHNDFGMAMANSFTAFKAGANFISCTVNGLGERAGNCALEEIVTAIYYENSEKISFDLSKLKELSSLVEKISDRKISESKPIVGESVFTHESGIHVDGILKNKSNYELFKPSLVGNKRKIVLGKLSGKKAIVNCFQKLGFFIKDKEAGIFKDSLVKKLSKNKNLDIEKYMKKYIKLKES